MITFFSLKKSLKVCRKFAEKFLQAGTFAEKKFADNWAESLQKIPQNIDGGKFFRGCMGVVFPWE